MQKWHLEADSGNHTYVNKTSNSKKQWEKSYKPLNTLKDPNIKGGETTPKMFAFLANEMQTAIRCQRWVDFKMRLD